MRLAHIPINHNFWHITPAMMHQFSSPTYFNKTMGKASVPKVVSRLLWKDHATMQMTGLTGNNNCPLSNWHAYFKVMMQCNHIFISSVGINYHQRSVNLKRQRTVILLFPASLVTCRATLTCNLAQTFDNLQVIQIFVFDYPAKSRLSLSSTM